MRTKAWLQAALVAAALLGARNASATINFATGNHPQPDEENILFGATDSGTVIHGATQSGVGVTFSSMTGQTLVQNAKGQADIFCSAACTNNGGNSKTDLNSLEIKVAAGYGALDFIGNLQNGTGSAKVTVTDQFGAVFNYSLGNGQNFFTLTAIDNEVITDIQITNNSTTAAFGFGEFKQPRISGVCSLQGTTCTAVPLSETTSSVAVLGLGLGALGLVSMGRNRRRAAL